MALTRDQRAAPADRREFDPIYRYHPPTTTAPAGFPAALREIRERAGLSQARLAARVGCDRSFLSRVEGGRKTPERWLVLELAAVLRCTDAERDRLLLLAGYAPVACPCCGETLAPDRRMVE